MILNKSLNVSVPWLPRLWSGISDRTYLTELLWGLNGTMLVKVFNTVPGKLQILSKWKILLSFGANQISSWSGQLQCLRRREMGIWYFINCLQHGLLRETAWYISGSHLVPGNMATRPQSKDPGVMASLVTTDSIKSTGKIFWKVLVLHLDHIRSPAFSQHFLHLFRCLPFIFYFCNFYFWLSHWTRNRSSLCLMLSGWPGARHFTSRHFTISLTFRSFEDKAR